MNIEQRVINLQRQKSTSHRHKAAMLMVCVCTTLLVDTVQAGDNITITLNEALAKTLENNPRLKSFSYQQQGLEARVLQAGLAPNPELSIAVEDVLGSGDYSSADNAQTTVSMAWVLERGLRQHYIGRARAELSQWDAQANAMRIDVTAETARRFLICLANQERYKHSQNVVRKAKATVNAVNDRVSAGKAPSAELARAKAVLALRTLQARDYEHEMLTSNYQLAVQWGSRHPAFTSVVGKLFTLPTPASLEAIRSRVKNNPVFTRLQSAKRVYESELALAKAERKSSWRVSTGIRHFESSNDQAFALGLTIPLGVNNKNQGRIREAQVNIGATAAKTDEALIQIEATLFELYQELLHSLHIAEALQQEIIPNYEQALKETQRAYEIGRYSYQEWRVVQDELTQAHSGLIEASIEAHRNLIEIEHLTGVAIAQPNAQQGVAP